MAKVERGVSSVSAIRILVLTSSTGGGHDARALALCGWARRLYGWQVETRIEKMLEDSSRIARFGVGFYNFIQRWAPWFHHPYFLLIEGLSYLNRSRVSLGGRYYEEVIKNYRPHLVFSVHDCLNRGYFQTARRILGDSNVRCATYCSEFSGGYGYSRNWVEKTVDMYLSRTRTAADYAIAKLGLPSDRVLVRGHFLDPKIYEETLSDSDRHRFITERLGLRSDRRIVFITTGGAGANNHLSILPVLRNFSEKYQAIVVCGRNQDTFMRVRNWVMRHPELSCRVEGYTREMHLFLQASDIVITRGGTTTCSEALHYGCPIVFNGFGGVMPQERLTVKYFLQDNAAGIVSNPSELETLLAKWGRYPETFERVAENFRNLRFEGDPSQAVRDLVNLAKEAKAGKRAEGRIAAGRVG